MTSQDSHPPSGAKPGTALAERPESNGQVTPEAQTRILVEHLLGALGTDNSAEEKSRGTWSWATYAGAMRRRWKPMLALALLTFGLTVAELKPNDQQFTAASTMLLPAKSNAAAQSADTLGVLSGLVRANVSSIDTQIAILTSPSLIEDAISRLTKADRLAGWKVTSSKDAARIARVSALAGASSDIINITVQAGDANVAVKLANNMITAFADRSQNLASRSTVKNINLLQQQVEDAYKLMLKAKDNLRIYKEQHGIVDLDTRLKESAEKLQSMVEDEAKARDAVEAGVGDSLLASDEIRNKAMQDLAEAKERYAILNKDFFPGDPQAKKARDDVNRLQHALDLRTSSLLKVNRSRLNDAEKSLNDLKRGSENLPVIELQLTQLESKTALLEDTYKQVYDRYTDLQLGRNTQIETATSLIAAEKAVSANRPWFVIIGLGLSCALAMAGLLAMVLEALDHTIHSTDDLKSAVTAPILGTMPMMHKGEERRLALVTSTQPSAGVLLEACRILRSNLTFAADGNLKSVLLTSADPGEGKSLSAYNLATVMALDGRRVLLLDCDLRRPSQHLQAGLPLEPGLSNVLSGEASLESGLQVTGIANLTLLAAGALPSNPPELLGSEAMRALVAELKEKFDLVVLDSPPILSLTDAQVLSSLADGTLLVVAADATPRPHIERAQSMLRHVGARLLGVIFNKAQEHQDEYLWQSYHNGYITEALPPGKSTAHDGGN